MLKWCLLRIPWHLCLFDWQSSVGFLLYFSAKRVSNLPLHRHYHLTMTRYPPASKTSLFSSAIYFFTYFFSCYSSILVAVLVSACSKLFLSLVNKMIVWKQNWFLFQGHQVYRKSTHTDRYLHAESNHHAAQKQFTINSLVHRAFTISDKNIYRQN